jgi:hypothetical protein
MLKRPTLSLSTRKTALNTAELHLTHPHWKLLFKKHHSKTHTLKIHLLFPIVLPPPTVITIKYIESINRRFLSTFLNTIHPNKNPTTNTATKHQTQ